jgi:pilus assembly protein Flp/PilA
MTMKLAQLANLNRLLKDDRGANMVEYIILVGVVAILAMAGFKYFGSSVQAKIQAQGDTVGSVQSS